LAFVFKIEIKERLEMQVAKKTSSFPDKSWSSNHEGRSRKCHFIVLSTKILSQPFSMVKVFDVVLVVVVVTSSHDNGSSEDRSGNSSDISRLR
jgi:hypothetical protein